MNGIHDLGGMEGFGSIQPQRSEPVFHEAWEGSVFATVMACMAQGLFTIDEFRHAIERMGNSHYVSSGYYEHWLAALNTILCEKNIVDAAALEARITEYMAESQLPPRPAPIGDQQLAPALAAGIKTGSPSLRESEIPARFRPGDRVRTRNLHPRGHIRLPAYARDKACTIHCQHGVHVLPDANAHGLGEQPEHLYTVCFESSELWGEESDRVRGTQYLDVWESYLQAS